MEKTTCLIVGAGVTGLAFANFINTDDYIVLEADAEIGGYCKTVHQDGFVWDYSGHFFHFRHPEIERFLVERMPPDEVRTIQRVSRIHYKGHILDFPFQKNIHQLPRDEFIECLYDLFFKEETYGDGRSAASFKELVYARFGRGIAEKFLVPYNEKLYACDLAELDVHAMGRFFPWANLADIVRNMRAPDNSSYNATFTYPRGGAIQYIRALEAGLAPDTLRLSTPLVRIDLANKIAHTHQGPIAFEYLISSAPFDRLLAMTGLEYDASAYHSNKVLVFNLGFDKKGWDQPHWVYFPERKYRFYRVGFYDNIFGTDRMSLYIEIGARTEETFDIPAELERVLADLRTAGIVDDHQLVSHHHVVLDPAYVHITTASQQGVERMRKTLAARGVYSLGRYGGWTYCSIEDNILEARDLAQTLNALPRSD